MKISFLLKMFPEESDNIQFLGEQLLEVYAEKKIKKFKIL